MDGSREQVLYPVLEAAGIKRKARENGFHAFRHAAGSILYEITRDIELVKRFLRHCRISTTSDIYVHPLGLTNEATAAMANVFLAVEEAKGVQGRRDRISISQIPSLNCKWLRGRDLNPRPLGYECNFLVARPFVF